jgi:CheY-like chemotaxis protein
MRRMLRHVSPLEVEEAEDGLQAVELYTARRFDLVLMDLTMPVMNGYEACAAILQLDSDAHVAVISADVQPLARQRCIEAGAFTFIHKPFDRARIEALIEHTQRRIAC